LRAAPRAADTPSTVGIAIGGREASVKEATSRVERGPDRRRPRRRFVTATSPSPFAIAVSAVLIAALTAGGLLFAFAYWSRTVQADNALNDLLVLSARLNALEWAAISRGRVDAATHARMVQYRTTTDHILVMLPRLAGSATRRELPRVGVAYIAYLNATDKEFSGITVGVSSAERAADQAAVDARFTELDRALDHTVQIGRGEVIRQEWIALGIAAGTALAATALIGLLFRRAQRAREQATLAKLELDAVESSERRYGSLINDVLNASPSATIISAADGRVVWVNWAFERFFVMPASLAMCLSRDELAQRIGLAPGETEPVPGDRDQAPLEVHIPGELGRQERWVEHRVVPITAGVYAGGLVEQIYDITDRKQVEQRQEDFFAMVSHDLRSPLAAMSGTLDLIESTGPGAQREELAADAIPLLADTTKRMTQFVEELLTLLKIQGGKLSLRRQAADLAAVIQDAVARTHVDEDHRIRVEVDPELPIVEIDPALVRHALMNLLDNAIKYSPEGGDVYVRADDEHGRVRVRVTDRGIGIAPGSQPHIFDRFRQVAESGSTGFGLGLYIVRQIVEAHGGVVGVASEQGKGTTFTIDLPVAGR
jgi:signal transduction histidine kinase